MPPTPPPPPHHPPRPPHSPVLHKPLPDDEKPISPPLDSLAHQKPPKENKGKLLILSIIFGTIITGLMGLILKFFNISLNVILPVLAPIWVGTITLIYSVNSKN